MKCRGAALEERDLVLAKWIAWKGRHKIQDRWESGEYQVVGQPTPGVPVYTVKSVAGGRTRVLHYIPKRNKISSGMHMRRSSSFAELFTYISLLLRSIL